jgi:hypothetical protein
MIGTLLTEGIMGVCRVIVDRLVHMQNHLCHILRLMVGWRNLSPTLLPEIPLHDTTDIAFTVHLPPVLYFYLSYHLCFVRYIALTQYNGSYHLVHIPELTLHDPADICDRD